MQEGPRQEKRWKAEVQAQGLQAGRQRPTSNTSYLLSEKREGEEGITDGLRGEKRPWKAKQESEWAGRRCQASCIATFHRLGRVELFHFQFLCRHHSDHIQKEWRVKQRASCVVSRAPWRQGCTMPLTPPQSEVTVYRVAFTAWLMTPHPKVP